MNDLMFEFFEDLWWYRGAVVTPPSIKDNRIQVQVLPHMFEIEQVELYPYYPPFFKSDFINVVKGDIVWVLCTEDFTTGYVFGVAQKFSYDSTPIYSSTLETIISKLNEVESSYGLGLTTIDDIHVTFCNDKVVQFVNNKTGTAGSIHSSGTLDAVIGKGWSVIISGTSLLVIKPDEISLTADTVRFNTKNLILGNSGQSVVTTTNKDPMNVGPAALFPSETIKG